MEEWEGERYKGIGIKKMKGYKCILPIDKLNLKREEFEAIISSALQKFENLCRNSIQKAMNMGININQ